MSFITIRPSRSVTINIFLTGKFNTRLATDEMNPDELIEGALHATCEVTKAMATGNLVCDKKFS